MAHQGVQPKSTTIDRSDRPGHIGLVLLLASILVGAILSLRFLSSDQAQRRMQRGALLDIRRALRSARRAGAPVLLAPLAVPAAVPLRADDGMATHTQP